jgi:hypothetical protein
MQKPNILWGYICSIKSLYSLSSFYLYIYIYIYKYNMKLEEEKSASTFYFPTLWQLLQSLIIVIHRVFYFYTYLCCN